MKPKERKEEGCFCKTLLYLGKEYKLMKERERVVKDGLHRMLQIFVEERGQSCIY